MAAVFVFTYSLILLADLPFRILKTYFTGVENPIHQIGDTAVSHFSPSFRGCSWQRLRLRVRSESYTPHYSVVRSSDRAEMYRFRRYFTLYVKILWCDYVGFPRYSHARVSFSWLTCQHHPLRGNTTLSYPRNLSNTPYLLITKRTKLSIFFFCFGFNFTSELFTPVSFALLRILCVFCKFIFLAAGL